jgi:hypothetical protein
MPSARLHPQPATRPLASEAAPCGAAWRLEGSRPRPRLRLAWSADRAPDQPAWASGPVQAFAPHRGAACRLSCPGPSVTSSATRLRERWALEFEPTRRQEPDPLIGWIGGADPLAQVRLKFPTREAALAYAERHGLACEVSEPHRRRTVPRSYAENFLPPGAGAVPLETVFELLRSSSGGRSGTLRSLGAVARRAGCALPGSPAAFSGPDPGGKGRSAPIWRRFLALPCHVLGSVLVQQWLRRAGISRDMPVVAGVERKPSGVVLALSGAIASDGMVAPAADNPPRRRWRPQSHAIRREHQRPDPAGRMGEEGERRHLEPEDEQRPQREHRWRAEPTGADHLRTRRVRRHPHPPHGPRLLMGNAGSIAGAHGNRAPLAPCT